MRALVLPTLLLGLVAPALADDLRAGAAAVVITPPPGTPMAGYYSARFVDEVHDDLHAKALVLESGGTRVALVALDLITTPRDLTEEARREIEKSTGLSGANVMISATHTHTGPVLRGRSRRDDAVREGKDQAQSYRASLPGKIAEAVRLAEERLAPASLRVGRGEESSIAFNRRYHMQDGTVGWNPGKLNPRIIKPAGPIDPDVPVVFVESDKKEPIATYVNYAVHLDNVGGPAISADLPHTLSKLLGNFLGDEMVTLWTAGCCGDINHVNVNWAAPQKGHENAARMGTILAAEVLRTWPKLQGLESPGALAVRSEIVELELPEINPGDVERAREVVAQHQDPAVTKKPPFLETVDAYKILDVAERNGEPQKVEVQVVALGDSVAWVSLPGEIFCELGLAIKERSPFPLTVIAELANGSIGYIPSQRAYPQGNYEVVSARCAEGSGERLVDSALRMLEELHSEAKGSDTAAQAAAPTSEGREP